MGKIVTVFTEEAPKPLGHYSQAVRGGGLIHISGQLPIAKAVFQITSLLPSTRKPSWFSRTFWRYSTPPGRKGRTC